MTPIKFEPSRRESVKVANVVSAWGNIPTVLADIIDRFNVKKDKALEFGVEYGYSTSAIANYFEKVVGVDTFEGDIHAGIQKDAEITFQETKNRLAYFGNVKLHKESYQTFIARETEDYDFIHIDIVHDYPHTFECGDWAVQHAPVVIFHDTLSFPDVMKACQDLAVKHDLEFHNYEESYGLGILVRKDASK